MAAWLMCVVYKCHPTVGVEPFYHDFDSHLVCFSGNLSLSPAHFPLQQLKKRRKKKQLLNDKCCYCVVGAVVSHPRRHTPADCDEFTPEHQQFPPLTTLGCGSRCTSDPTFFPSVGGGGWRGEGGSPHPRRARELRTGPPVWSVTSGISGAEM